MGIKIENFIFTLSKKQVKNGDFSKIAFAIPYITRDYKVEVKLKSGVLVHTDP
ncbi:MAG: hypothetical protein U9R01_03680 [candidate division WOR-3 bacterium]|nr:hypothetical protein [candidate division WOR-3 bacterium]